MYVVAHTSQDGIGDDIFTVTSFVCITVDFLDPLKIYNGRFMQTIAGVHYNFSMPDSFWQHLHQLEGTSDELEKDFISKEYLSLIRNFRRTSWLIPYFFGASPAICESYLKGKKTHLDQLVPNTVYGHYATSLRLGDLGYSNNAQASLNVTYNCIEGYIDGLEHAIQTPEPLYEQIGVIEDGDYKQLNANLLQIDKRVLAWEA